MPQRLEVRKTMARMVKSILRNVDFGAIQLVV